MGQDSWVWPDNGVGDASPLTMAEMAKVMNLLAGKLNATVIRGYRSELQPSVSGSTIDVASGGAVVDGHPYENDATINFDPPNATVGTTGRMLVLRSIAGATQTVRLIEISSAPGTATIPSPTTSVGGTYDLPICSYTVTTGGAIGAFTDLRTFNGPPNSGFAIVTATGDYTIPASEIEVECIGGGGGGGGCFGSQWAAGSGAAGGRSISRLTGLTVGSTVSCTIGAGGAGGAGTPSPGQAGSAGGTTSFGSHASATGGAGGGGGTNFGRVLGGIGSGPHILIRGAPSDAGAIAETGYYPSAGGSSPYGAGGRGGLGTSGAGEAAQGNGAGGGGAYSSTSQAGGNGSPGLIIVRW